MLSNIIKKITSTSVPKAKLQEIANILNIKMTKSEIQKDIDSGYLKKVQKEFEKDERQSFLDRAEGELLLDDIELKQSMSRMKKMFDKAPKPTIKKPADDQAQKVFNFINKLEKAIDLQGSYKYYVIDGDDVKLLKQGQNKNKTKKEALQRLTDKPKFVDSKVFEVQVRINRKFVTKSSTLVPGPVSLAIIEYRVNDSYKLEHDPELKNGVVWYTNNDLENNRFHFKDIPRIIKMIDEKNINIISVGKVHAVDVLDTKPTTEPKQQLKWIEHVKKYAIDHNVSYRDALKQAGATYVKKQKSKTTKKPKEKNVHEYQCEFCKYKSTDKSNYNRHFKKHIDRQQLMNSLMRTRGLIRTHKVRAETSKKKDVRTESQLILDQAMKDQKMILSILKRLEAGEFKTNTKTKVKITTKAKKTVAKATTKIPKYVDELIENLNKTYEDNNEEKLGLTKENITEFKKTGDDIIMKMKDLEVDDGESIDIIELEYDTKMEGYNVSLIQNTEIKNEMKNLEYDSFYMY